MKKVILYSRLLLGMLILGLGIGFFVDNEAWTGSALMLLTALVIIPILRLFSKANSHLLTGRIVINRQFVESSIRWNLGLLLVLAGAGGLRSELRQPLAATALLLVGVVLMPPLDKIIFEQKPANYSLPKSSSHIQVAWLKIWPYIGVMIAMGAFGSFYEKDNTSGFITMGIALGLMFLSPAMVYFKKRNLLLSTSPVVSLPAFTGEDHVVQPLAFTSTTLSSADDYLRVIGKGENAVVEFKSTLRFSIRANRPEKIIEHAVLKTIAAFLNSGGGVLLIGVADDKTICGLEKDFNSFSKENKLDEFQKHLDNMLGNSIGNRFHRYLDIEFPELEGKAVCVIKVRSGSSEPVYIQNENGQELFYIRRLASTIDLKPSEAVKYIREQWN